MEGSRELVIEGFKMEELANAGGDAVFIHYFLAELGLFHATGFFLCSEDITIMYFLQGEEEWIGVIQCCHCFLH